MKTVAITGANRGIGLALARQFSERGDRVIALCRSSSAELEKTGAQIETAVEVTDDGALAALAGRLAGRRIDTLVLNAGVLAAESFGQIDEHGFDDMRRQFEVNALGPLRVAQALSRNLGKGSRVGIITSRMGSIADNTSGGYYGYRASKAAVNAIGKSLAQDLKPRGIAVFLLHPGFVATDMVGGRGDVTAEQAARRLIERLDSLGLGQTGTFWHANGEALPW